MKKKKILTHFPTTSHPIYFIPLLKNSLKELSICIVSSPLLLISLNSNITLSLASSWVGSGQQWPPGCESMWQVPAFSIWLMSSIWPSWPLPAPWDTYLLEARSHSPLRSCSPFFGSWGSFVVGVPSRMLISLAVSSRFTTLYLFCLFFFFWPCCKTWGDLSSLSRTWTQAPFSGNTES